MLRHLLGVTTEESRWCYIRNLKETQRKKLNSINKELKRLESRRMKMEERKEFLEGIKEAIGFETTQSIKEVHERFNREKDRWKPGWNFSEK
jgi:uncharacterized protein YbcC (UPF0753/DUF2309 family)